MTTQKRRSRLPYLRVTLSFEYTNSGMVLHAHEYRPFKEYEFIRVEGRWRDYDRGNILPFVAAKSMAEDFFEFPQDANYEDLEWATEYVRDLGLMLDNMYSTIRETTNTRVKEEVAKEISIRAARIEQQEIQRRHGPTRVYLMRHKNGLIKIGKSRNPKAREKTLQAEDPELEMIFHWAADGDVERRLHEIFSSLRVRGEWFALTPHHVEWITFILKERRQTKVGPKVDPMADIIKQEQALEPKEVAKSARQKHLRLPERPMLV